MTFRKEITFSGSELVDIYTIIEHEITRENDFIELMSEPPEYEDEDYSESIVSAEKRIKELQALQNMLLIDK